MLIAVILSCKTNENKVNEVTSYLFEVADSATKMNNLDISKIVYFIKRLGLYNKKAKYIKETSKILIEKFNEKIPKNIHQLKSLPGVGQKTASVVMCCFNIPAFPVDTHIHRLMHIWGLSNGNNVYQTEKDAKKIFPKGIWKKIHLQMILYGKYLHKKSLQTDIILQKILELKR